MCQVKFKHMIVLVNLILTTTLGDITGFCKTCFQKTETGAYRNQVTTHHNSCKESDTTERLGFTSLDSIIPWLASGRSGVHLMLAHSEMDPGMSPACHEQFMSLVASLELSHMVHRFICSQGMVSGGMDLLQNFQSHPHRFPADSTQYPDLQRPLKTRGNSGQHS